MASRSKDPRQQSRQPQQPLRVLIVGGGIAGCALALALSASSSTPTSPTFDITICEAAPAPRWEGAGFQIAPNGMRILRRLGAELASEVEAAGRATPGGFLFRRGSAGGDLRISAQMQPDPNNEARVLWRSSVSTALGQALEQAGLSVRYNCALTGLEQRADVDTDPDRQSGKHPMNAERTSPDSPSLSTARSTAAITAHFADGSKIEADILVGADGVHSAVRGLILPERAAARNTGFVAMGGAADGEPPFGLATEPAARQSLNFFRGHGCQLGLMLAPPPPAHGILHRRSDSKVGGASDAAGSSAGSCWMWWTHMPAEAPDRREVQDAAWLRARVGPHLASMPLGGWLLEHTSDADLFATVIHDIPPLPCWHVGRALLIGDAAHAMSSAGGQGASMALEDAGVLAELLARHGRDYAAAFAAFEQRRRPRVEPMVAQAHANDIRANTPPSGWLPAWIGDWLGDWIIWLIAPLLSRMLSRIYISEP